MAWNSSCSRLPVHSRHLFYASLESTMIILRYFICYKALSYTCCEWQRSESRWPFARPRLIFTLRPPFIRWRIACDFWCQALPLFSFIHWKSWVWPGDEARKMYTSDITKVVLLTRMCTCICNVMHAWRNPWIYTPASLVPRPHPAFSMYAREKREGLVSEVAWPTSRPHNAM